MSEKMVRCALCGTRVPIHAHAQATPDGRFVDVEVPGPHMCRPKIPRVDNYGIRPDGSPEASAKLEALCKSLEKADELKRQASIR